MKILLIILAVLAFLLSIKVKIVIDFAEELTLTVRVLGIPIRILPARQKKVHIRRYSLRKMRRREQKQHLAQQKKDAANQKKAAEKKQRKAERKETQKGKPKAPLSATIRMVLALVKIVFSRLGRHLHIDVTRIRLRVAGADAAQTAILWGAVTPSLGALLALLDRITNLHTVKHCEIDVSPDFVGDSFAAEICIAFSLRVWHVFDIALRAGIGFLRHHAVAPNPPSVQAGEK